MTPIETKKNIHTNCLLFLFGHDRIACLNVSYQKGCGRQKGTSMQLRLPTREHFAKLVKKIAMFLFNPRLLLCFFLAWMITNGWCYLFIFFGQLFDLTWMTVAGSVWAGVVWFPFSPEKVVTLLLAILLLRWLFPSDEKTLLVLRKELQRAKDLIKRKKKQHHERKEEKQEQKEQPSTRANQTKATNVDQNEQTTTSAVVSKNEETVTDQNCLQINKNKQQHQNDIHTSQQS